MALRPGDSGLRQLDLNLLPVFTSLMRERSVTRAGQALFLSQPATSAALARLRAFFRDELFIRNGNALEPTPRAEALMAELEPALQFVAGAIGGATPFDPETDARTFRIGMSEDVGLAIIPLLPRLRAAVPNCRIVIRAANYLTIPGLLDAGEIGTAIGYFQDLPAAAKQRALRRDGFRVLRDASTPGPVDLDSYCARPHLLVTPRGDLTGFVDEVLKQMGRSRQVVLGVPEFGLMPRTLLGSDMLCVVSEALVEALMATEYGPRLAADPPPFPCPDSVIRMAWRTALDHDPGEVWLRGQLIQWLTRRG